MKKESTSFGLAPKKLAKLLGIGSDIPETAIEVDQKQKKAELLHDRLAENLPTDPALVKSTPVIREHESQTLEQLAGESIKGLLLNSKANILVIKSVKDYCKKLTKGAKSKFEHDTAVVIYYLAIASALLFHDKKITTYSYKSLADSFSKLIAEGWLPKDIVKFFEQASQLCQEKDRSE